MRIARQGAWIFVALSLGVIAASGCGVTTAPTTTASGDTVQISIEVQKPSGPGPFPAVVIAHDCSGLRPASSGAPGRWARELVSRGYVAVIPDSFSTRGFPDGVCSNPNPGRQNVSPAARARDAYAALAHARTLAYVDGKRVGLMGGSHGGSTTLASMLAPDSDAEPLAAEKRAGFAAAVALYPACTPSSRTWLNRSGAYRSIAPLLILIGEKDDWTPAPPCQTLVTVAQREGQPVSLKIYPGAHHSFDSPHPIRFVATRINGNAPSGRGATTGGDPTAWSDAIQQVAKFFGEHLK
jgi:dienelactone hydrolase